MFEDEPLILKEDLELLMKLKKQGTDLVEDLFTVFSYHRPKEYKLYVENIQYNPMDKGKILLDLIFTIQRYNKLVEKEMEEYYERGKKSKYFSDLYKGAENFGKRGPSKSCSEIMNNILPKYEQRHLRFKKDFLKKNIFHDSGLLHYTLKQNIDFYDTEVRTNGVNSYKNFKYTIFIAKLYKQIQKAFKRQTLNNTVMIYENQKDRLNQLKQEKIMKKNMEKIRRKEIKLDKMEIEKLKKLNDIANETYLKIMESINNRKIKSKRKKLFRKDKTKSKSKSKSKSPDKNKEINNSKEDKINLINEDNNLINTKSNFGKTIESKFITKYNDKYNRTVSVEGANNTNFFNNGVTATTGFIDSKNNTSSNNFTFYNIHKDLINKLNILKKKNEKEKEMIKPFPIKINVFSRNKTTREIFPSLPKKDIKDQNKKIKLTINPALNSTTNNFQMLKSSSSVPLILNYDSKEKNQTTERKVKKKKKIFLKKEKLSKLDLVMEQRRKVPIIYEKLKSIKNLLNKPKRDIEHSSQAFKLFSELYGKKKILKIDEKKAPKELYNSYINMKTSIERKNRTGGIFKKYINFLNKDLEIKLEKSKEQDEKLKTKYYDLVQIIIKKKLENENEKF